MAVKYGKIGAPRSAKRKAFLAKIRKKCKPGHKRRHKKRK
jgi:hypothetical protein